MRGWVLVLLMFAAGGNASADRFVVIARTTPLFTAPREGAPAFAAAARDAREKHATWRVLGERDGFVEIQSIPGNLDDQDGARFCVDGEPLVARFRMRMFARTKELVPLLTRPFEKRYADGTADRLVAGTPIATHDARVLGIPAAMIGTSFEPGPAVSLNGRWLERLEGTVGGVRMRLESVNIVGVALAGRGTLVTVRDACGETVIKTAREVRLPADEEGIASAVNGGIGVGELYVGGTLRAGTIFSRDEAPIGSLRYNLPVSELIRQYDATREPDGRVCWNIRLSPVMHVCADAVPRKQPAPPRTATPPALDERQLRDVTYELPEPSTKLFDDLEARGKEQRIEVDYVVCIAANGRVENARVERASGFPAFDAQVLARLRAQRYARVSDGKAVCVPAASVFFPPISVDVE